MEPAGASGAPQPEDCDWRQVGFLRDSRPRLAHSIQMGASFRARLAYRPVAKLGRPSRQQAARFAYSIPLANFRDSAEVDSARSLHYRRCHYGQELAAAPMSVGPSARKGRGPSNPAAGRQRERVQ